MQMKKLSLCQINNMSKLTFLFIFLGAILMSEMVLSAPLTGRALIVKGVVSATNAAGETRLLAKKGMVHHQDSISTAEGSFVVIKMEDNTKITVRPESTVVIGEFDLTKGKEKGSIKLLKGALRTVTGLVGKTNPDGFKLETQVVTIGIRGTDFTTRICGSDCLVEERSIEGVEYISVTDPTLSAEVNETLPAGLYFYVNEGKIYAVQCPIGSPSCGGTINLDAGQSGYAGETDFGILPKVPLFIRHDPYIALSDFSDEQLDNLDVLQQDFSQGIQCDVEG